MMPDGGWWPVAARGLTDAALLQLFGALVFRTMIAPAGLRLARWSAASAIFASALWLVAEAVNLGGALSAVPDVLVHTEFGHLVTGSALCAAVALAMAGPGWRGGRGACRLAGRAGGACRAQPCGGDAARRQRPAGLVHLARGRGRCLAGRAAAARDGGGDGAFAAGDAGGPAFLGARHRLRACPGRERRVPVAGAGRQCRWLGRHGLRPRRERQGGFVPGAGRARRPEPAAFSARVGRGRSAAGAPPAGPQHRDRDGGGAGRRGRRGAAHAAWSRRCISSPAGLSPCGPA